MKLLGILCVPFPAQHAQPGGSPASSRDGSKPDDISSTGVLPNHSPSGLGPSSLSPLLTRPDFPYCAPGMGISTLGSEGGSEHSQPHGTGLPTHHTRSRRHPYGYTKEINKHIDTHLPRPKCPQIIIKIMGVHQNVLPFPCSCLVLAYKG